MLKKQNRLSRITRKQNETVFTSPLFNIKISDGDKEPRFGFVVSKTVSKSAVIRNKTKRILRNAVEELIEKMSPGKDIIVIAKRNLEKEQKQEVLDILTTHFKKAKILK